MGGLSELDRYLGGMRVERRCQQQVPFLGSCTSYVARRCDACGKLVCAGHIRLARLDPEVGGDRRWHSPGLPPEICTTCFHLEAWWARDRIEEVPAEVRERFYASSDAIGLVGAAEQTWLEQRRRADRR